MSDDGLYHADRSLPAKLRRRLVRLYRRQPAKAMQGPPMVSFCFDDTPASAVKRGGKALEARGVRGTYYFASGLKGEHSGFGAYAARDDMAAAAAAGHEIGCHTYSHLDCGKANAATIAEDLDRNAATLADWGVTQDLKTFAYPYGDVGYPAKAIMSERFLLSRGLHHGVITAGTDLNQAPAVSIEGPDGEARGRQWLQRAKQQRGWLILFTHGVEDKAHTYGCAEDVFSRLLDEALEAGFQVAPIEVGARRMRGLA